jgi:hypothetical protein
MVPFSISSVVAYLTWSAFPRIEAWHMIATVISWIVAFAAGTQLFWRGVELLAPK